MGADHFLANLLHSRHHVRFFPSHGYYICTYLMSLAYVDVPRDGDPKSGNCPPGFVADNGIDNPLAPDFFIQSHGGLLGSEFKEIYL